MNSFYGGKQGNSFIIAKTYTTITEMVESFGKNNSSCPVNFDEYVLINTVNKNNPENGQIFRRGYDYNSERTIVSYQPTYANPKPYKEVEIEANGAIYIGTIVGPAGRAPIFNFGQYKDIQDTRQIINMTYEDLHISTYYTHQDIINTLNTKYPNGYEAAGDSAETAKDFYTLRLYNPPAQYQDEIIYYFCYDKKYELNNQATLGWYAVDAPPSTGEDRYAPGQGLIPGVTYAYENDELLYDIDADGKRHIRKGQNPVNAETPYQDSIDWTYCTVRNENLEDSTAYIGFRFASPVIEFETESVDAYYNRSDIIGENGLPNEASPLTHEFTNLNLIERAQTKDDIESHPFYSLWKINIPKGIKGESIHNFRCITANSDVYKFKLDNEGNLSYNNIEKFK